MKIYRHYKLDALKDASMSLDQWAEHIARLKDEFGGNSIMSVDSGNNNSQMVLLPLVPEIPCWDLEYK